jgi:hypothetical protein
VQILFILIPKAKIRRNICKKIRWSPVDFRFNGLKQKNLNIKGLICNKKNTKIKTKQSQTYNNENNI